jgi:hypothetical protein
MTTIELSRRRVRVGFGFDVTVQKIKPVTIHP